MEPVSHIRSNSIALRLDLTLVVKLYCRHGRHRGASRGETFWTLDVREIVSVHFNMRVLVDVNYSLLFNSF